MLAVEHDHDGRCSGRLRLGSGAILREIVCDDCDALVDVLDPLPYSVPVLAPALRAA